jgi:hypothetical protein
VCVCVVVVVVVVGVRVFWVFEGWYRVCVFAGFSDTALPSSLPSHAASQRTHAMRALFGVVPLEPLRSSWRAAAGFFGLCLIGYAANLLPYAAVARSTFVYHYMPALLFAELLAGRLVDLVPSVGGLRHAVGGLYVGIVALGFWYWSPWVYGTPLTRDEHVARQWLPRWN